MVTDLGHGGEGSRLGSHHDGPGGRGRERGPGEEGCALVFGQGVGVQVVTGAGQTGHAVSGGRAQTALGQMQSTAAEFEIILIRTLYLQLQPEVRNWPLKSSN